MVHIEQVRNIYERIAKEKPLVHCITNIVTVNDCANILLASGASPTMSHHPLEVEDVTAGCGCLVCNMGAMESLDAMELAMKTAKALHKPIILDPVGSAGASFRRESCLRLIKTVSPTCIRGNYSEILALAREERIQIGVDAAPSKQDQVIEACQTLAYRYGCFVVASGAIDIITDGTNVYKNTRGSSMMSRITGAGCMESALLGAFLAVEESFLSVISACVVMGMCGEIAERKTKELHGGTGTYHIRLLDAVSLFCKEDFMEKGSSF